jgi:hypothetical protein
MKRFLLWSFERGSIHYDIICGIIFAFILIAPGRVFNDRPDFMRVPVLGPNVRPSHDDDGNKVFTVKLQTGVFSTDSEESRQAALKSLAAELKTPIEPSKMEPVHDTTGALVAYAVWVLER